MPLAGQHWRRGDWAANTLVNLACKTIATGIVSPEGPAADRLGNIFLVSRWTGRVVKVSPNGGVDEFAHPEGKPQAVALLDSGDLLLANAGHQALQKISRHGEVSTIVTLAGGKRLLGPNDLVLGDNDVVYLTDPGLDMETKGQIVRIDLTSGEVSPLAEGYGFPNGITMTADGCFLLVAESVPHRVLRFELLDQGRRLGVPEIFYQFPDHYPDGLALDADGNLIVALWAGGTLAVISPQGTLLEAIPTGGMHPTNCEFGGDDFQTLYVTEDDQQALLSVRWPVPGQRRYARSLSKTPCR